MHRTFSVPRRIGWWSLLVSVTLHVGIQAASAQNILQPASFPGRQEEPQRPVILMAVGTSLTCAMTSKADLKRVENPNSKVVRVGRVPDKNNEILLVAEYPGRTQVTLIDHRDHAEVRDVVVTGEVPQDAKNVAKVRFEKGDQKTFKLEKVPLGGLRIAKSEVVEIRQSQTDPMSFTVIAVGPGTTRVFFYADKGQQDILAVYDFEVAPEDAIGQLRDFIRTLPTAGVTATPIRLPAGGGDKRNEKAENGVILTGKVTVAQDATAIVAVAKRLFPATILGQQTTAVGGLATANDLLRENVINYIEIGGVQQVDLHVVVAVVNRSRGKQLQFSWNTNGPNWFASSIIGGGPFALSNILSPVTPATTTASLTGPATSNLALGILNNNNSFLGFLQILTSEGVTKILAEPRVTTLSGRPAYIVSGGETPILTSSGVGAPSVSYKNFGTVVSCLPTVMGNGKILLEVKPEISSINAANGVTIGGATPTAVPGFDTRSAQVTIQVEDGQTLAIGGLVQNKFTNTVTKVPVLGDIPILQAFFSQKSLVETEEEMIILVTPRLVDPIDCTKIPQYLPGRETRPPDDFEFFLEGILEAPRKPRNVVFHPHVYQAAYKGAPNVGQIPCADGSCNGQPAAGCATGNCAPSAPRSAVIQSPTTGGTVANFAAPPTVPAPTIATVPATATSNPNRIVIEPEGAVVPPPIRDVPPSFGPAMPIPPTIQPTIPPAPPRELQNRPVLPPLSPSTNSPN
jgi:Flp pilus assembly secretin CpaC